jgi:hypothetical protein
VGQKAAVLEVAVKRQMELLVELQDRDKTLNQLNREIRFGPERIKEVQGQVEALEEDLELHKRQIQDVQKAQRQLESEVEDSNARIRKSKGRLLTIKSNKEYQALLKEIEEGERANREREDKILACMEETEELKQLLKKKAEEVSVRREDFEDEKRTIEEAVSQAQQRLAEEEQYRAEIVIGIDPDLLKRYEHIKTKSGGLAVVFVENTTCSGCHLNIPPQMYNELQRRDSLKFCPNCERIIYWKENNTVKKEEMSE